jgi:1-phosphatidylinositol-3-phosphate 5-kinase
MARESLHEETLHQMHASASRSVSLTTFDHLTAPPPPATADESKGIDLVHGGLSSLYSRIKASVGSIKDTTVEDGFVGGSQSKAGAKGNAQVSKSPAGTAVSSPVVVSVPSSRLQSPLVASFPDRQLPPSRESNMASSVVSSKFSLNGSKSSLATAWSKPSLALSMEPSKASIDDDIYEPSQVITHSRAHSSSVVAESSARLVSPSAASFARTGEPFRLQMQLDDLALKEEGSDTTEDDMVVVDGGGLANDNARFAFPPKVSSDGLTKVSSQVDPHYKPVSALKGARVRLDHGPESTEAALTAANTETQDVTPAPPRPPMVHVGPSHLPGYHLSRASSSDGVSSVYTNTTARSSAVAPIDELRQQTLGKVAASNLPNSAVAHMRRKILSREFWMQDANAKDCFNCGDSFSTFRRKHHCRTCGQIFDSKCTSIVSGNMFGQSGTLRVCIPCETIIYGNDDDSSVYSEDGDSTSIYERPIYEKSENSGALDPEQAGAAQNDHTKIPTPTISIPMTRKSGSEKKRRSAVIEVAPPALARPSSSRSLRSLSGRPRSSSHKRHHQHMRNVRYDDTAPFHQQDVDSARNRSVLPAFHHDNIIDPDLAPYMSDEGSSEDEQASISATLRGDTPSQIGLDSEKSGLGSLFTAMRKGKSRTGERNGLAGHHLRDADNASIMGRHMNRHPRRRNLSVSSAQNRLSPKRTKSNSLLRPFGTTPGGTEQTVQPPPSPPHRSELTLVPSRSRITRSASMQGGNAPVIELNQASLQHVRKLLKQMLQAHAIPHVGSWEKALMPILLQCTDDVNPDVRKNDDMDIRHYIKLKKIPGGRPSDTCYVSGVVFTKNVAKKSMPRNISNPRIVIVTFAIEYARHQAHFMSLEPVIAQEREYLRNLVGRIAALEPHLLLVQKSVSGLALEFLEEAGIVVAYNVKPTVLNAVARCTQSPMISSVDKLAIDPAHLGQCDSFDVKTYVHKGTRRTHIYLSGCQPELGCTIALRGADMDALKKLKRVTEFMCFVVYHLKLETCLMRDGFVLVPNTSTGGTLAQHQQEEGVSQASATHQKGQRADKESSGIAVTEKPPQLTSEVPYDIPPPSFYSEMVEEHQTTILSVSPFVKFAQPYLLKQAREYERKLEYLKKLRDQYTTEDFDEAGDASQKFELVQPEMVHVIVEKASKQVREFLHAVHAAEYDKALHNYQTQKRQWEVFLSGNSNLFDPFTHQKIAVLYSTVNSKTSTPCTGPDIIAMGFYQEHEYEDGFTPDCTLGQYVEDVCQAAGASCEEDGCDLKMIDHHRQYVHGPGQISVHVTRQPPKLKNMHHTILMWSCCRVCNEETRVMPMSQNTWKYSFAKFLELTFWISDLHPRAHMCEHDIHKDHIRYFGLNNLAVRFMYDPVQLYEVIVPRPVIAWKVDWDLKMKNELFLKSEERLDRFMASVHGRLRSIRVESVIPEKVEACRAEVEKLMKRASEENDWLRKKLQDKYVNSKYYEIIPLNRAIRAIQEKAIAWDETFTEFEQEFFPSEKDIKRLAALQLKRLFLERDESNTSLTSVEEGTESVEEETAFNEKGEPLPLAPISSSMSQERARDMLNSVVEEDQTNATMSELSPTESARDQTPTNTTSASSQELPIQRSIEALEREDVRHLDLAIASNILDNVASMEEQLGKTPTRALEADIAEEPGSPTPLALPRVNPLDKYLTEVIENMPTSPTPAQTFSGTLESKIPRLVEANRREPGSRPVVMTRTQSQPGGVLKTHSHQSIPLSNIKMGEPTNSTPSDSGKALERRLSERLALGVFKQNKSSSMIPIPRSIPFKRPKEAPKVSNLRKHFEQLQREFEKERKRERLHQQKQNRQARAYPLASSKPIVEVYKDVHEAVQEHSPSDEDVQPSPARISIDNSTLEDSALTEIAEATLAPQSPAEHLHLREEDSQPAESEDHQASASHPTSDVENETSDVETMPEDLPLPDSITSSQLLDSPLESSLELPKHEKTTLMKMLTSFWSERSASGWVTLDYPLSQNEHVWEDSDIIVREDEPSSIIALALSSTDYTAKLQSFRDDPTVAANGVGGLEGSEASIERNLLHEANKNIRYGFTNRGVRASCKIFYAQSFDALRRKCGVADRFVESLSRCSKWDSKGGKSKSIFLKTLDERFVIKSLSPVEVNAFFRFAPNYFAFTHQNLFKGLPSVIAKMFGLFQVQIKTPGGRDFDYFMLVMENLFYEREPTRRYDLKGSMRNRRVESRGDRDEVLLDENLVDIIYSETPIFVREHTKKLLKASVWNDTLFLSQQNVMDYSLMAGFHDDHKEITVGIIGMDIPNISNVVSADKFFSRLYTHIYLGQEARILDQRPRQEQADYYFA